MGISHPRPSSDRRAAVGKKTTRSLCLIRVRRLFLVVPSRLVDGGLPAILVMLILLVLRLRDGVNPETTDPLLLKKAISAIDMTRIMALGFIEACLLLRRC